MIEIFLQSASAINLSKSKIPHLDIWDLLYSRVCIFENIKDNSQSQVDLSSWGLGHVLKSLLINLGRNQQFANILMNWSQLCWALCVSFLSNFESDFMKNNIDFCWLKPISLEVDRPIIFNDTCWCCYDFCLVILTGGLTYQHKVQFKL